METVRTKTGVEPSQHHLPNDTIWINNPLEVLMKKSLYVLGGVLIGVVVATSSSAIADGVKSLIGKKVTGEYTITVNGERLTDKGAIIDGKANVPVRAISESLGAEIKVSGKTITVTTEPSNDTANSSVNSSNQYASWSKADLVNRQTTLRDNILAPTQAERQSLLKELEQAKADESEVLIETLEKQIAVYDNDIAKYTAELEKVEAALASIK
jgi:hypothetical protein